jgi:hypothetical protein
MSDWREGLTHKDWLFDGSAIRTEYAIDRFNHLDWSKAWVDIGPSIAGNLGPYWHVPLSGDDQDDLTIHRLYPKVLTSKWLLVIRQACIDYAALQAERASRAAVAEERCRQQADRIEALEAALRKIAGWPSSCEEARNIARAALGKDTRK